MNCLVKYEIYSPEGRYRSGGCKVFRGVRGDANAMAEVLSYLKSKRVLRGREGLRMKVIKLPDRLPVESCAAAAALVLEGATREITFPGREVAA